jgi:hypothetical protein
MNVAEHLDPETIYELTDGQLDPVSERFAEAHLLRCAPCRDLRDGCEATLGALRGYGKRSPEPPAGYWEGFWSRWPLAGGVRPPRPARRAPAVAAAAVALLAVGLWWAIERMPMGLERLASPALVTSLESPFAPAHAPPARELVAGTSWEGDIEVLERITFALGSVDPLSKGVALTSLVEEP